MRPAASPLQHSQQLGNVTRRIVERLDRRRPRRKGVAKSGTEPTAAAQRKAAFHDARQMQLPINPPNTKDQSHDET